MKVLYSERLRRSYEDASPPIRKAFDKQIQFLLKDIRHSSIRAKKYGEPGDVWQGRINKSWRFYFSIRNGTYYILDISPHPK